MNFWWLDSTARLAAELKSVDATIAEGWFNLTHWGVFEELLGAEGVITVHGHAYPVRLLYPDQYPLVPAWVVPQDPTVQWSNHQYGPGGVLCLELRPDTWHRAATGGDVLRSAFNLLEIENPLGDGDGYAPSGGRVGGIQSYTWSGQPVLVGNGCMSRIKSGDAEGLAALRWLADDGLWPAMVFDAVDRARPEHPLSFDLGTLRNEIPVWVGRALPPSVPSSRRELSAMAGVQLDDVADNQPLVVIALTDEQVAVYHSPDAQSVHERQWVEMQDNAGKRSGRATEAGGKIVSIVGLGSVGAKIAESLVRSGMRRFRFFDGDVFLPGNIERHILDWRDVGFLKAGAVARRLKHLVYGVEIETHPTNLNWQRSAKAQANLIDRLASSDLIIDATGSVPSAMLLGAVAAQNRVPFLSTSVFEGGLGSLIGRYVPDRDPVYTDARAAYIQYCAEQGMEPPPSGVRDYESIDDDGQPIVADDAAVSMAASHATRVALDILDNKVGDRDAAWLLLGFRKGWLFSRHGDTISLSMPVTPTAPPERDEAAEAFAIELARKAIADAVARAT